jgi:hypothetical protein
MQAKPSIFLPSLYGGIVIATISNVPGLNFLNCFCCAGVIFGGLAAVFFYSKELTPEMPPLKASDGVLLGALAGVVAAFLSLLLHLVIFSLFGNIAEQILYQLIHAILEAAEAPPDVAQLLEDKFQEALEQGLTPLVLFLSLIRDLFLFTLFGLLGGLLGYTFFKKPVPPVQPAAPSA